MSGSRGIPVFASAVALLALAAANAAFAQIAEISLVATSIGGAQ